MSMSEAFEALRNANPRAGADFNSSVDAAADTVRAQIAAAATPDLRTVRRAPRRRLLSASVVGATLVAGAAVALTIGSPGSGPRVESAAAAVKRAATVTAASADRSGVAVIRITRDGELWAGSTVRWHDGDLAVSSDAPRRPGRAGSELLVVGGIMYGIEPPDGGWVVLGSPENIDPGSGTTPAEYLAAVREDVGGVTLRRLTEAMTALTTRRLDDGSTVYSGAVAAGLIARKSGFKGGQPIRVLPFGYVAHDEAADPASSLAVAVTVGADDIVRKIGVTWGVSRSAWTYTVTYGGLGTTAAPVAPADARPLRNR
jgi:hypothetical protein